MAAQTPIELHRQIKIEMLEKNLSPAYVRKKLRLSRPLFSMALSGDRVRALNLVVRFVRKHRASPTYLKP